MHRCAKFNRDFIKKYKLLEPAISYKSAFCLISHYLILTCNDSIFCSPCHKTDVFSTVMSQMQCDFPVRAVLQSVFPLPPVSHLFCPCGSLGALSATAGTSINVRLF